MPPIHAAYEERIGCQVAASTVYRMLARHGWRKVAPDTGHPKRDAQAQSAVVQNAGHEATCAHTLKEGLERASTEPIDVIYLDVMMPDGNGLDLLPKLKKTASRPEWRVSGCWPRGIAHDFNNILMAIIGHTDVALSNVPKESSVRPNLESVRKAAHRATDMVRQIVIFSRQTEQERKPVLIAPLVKEVLNLLRASLPSTIEMRQNIAISLEGSTILADPTQIHQVIMNLCANAVYAMRAARGILSVSLSDADTCLVSQYPDLKPGPYVMLTVSDTGCGMDAAVMERMFEPSFTTKGLDEGSGIGLSTVLSIVKGHGGAISAYSEPGQGATFSVLLPLIDKDTEGRRSVYEALGVGGKKLDSTSGIAYFMNQAENLYGEGKLSPRQKGRGTDK